ncbi:DNA-deoxyinosine glycosylase [Methylovulum psychrotolerans]|uniref:DNA-deoxyinosine glycosylase n=1 Tax=Methylovulum psychrotolerans TaxID=1704499 RepID=UPI001BFEFCDF|nr:DNA-deoxyinosine glycosylase [Methylovulum psychrotolerans]MBT9098790.1 DNA-deoxyinosine glycosylase [Methylovulum psychrotolerans]
MTKHTAFPPIADPYATVLVLGSMPGAASLQAQQYYAHPRNAFWPIMAALFGELPPDYAQRQALLKNQKMAVWDVLRKAARKGSLDANIDPNSIEVNDFLGFYRQHPSIVRVFFNGGMAEKIYRQRVLPMLGEDFCHLHYQRLPSTSPAYATLAVAEKIAAWQAIKPMAMAETVIK